MTIGQRIAAKRKELGLSQADLGERMGVSRQSISKWEADAAIPEIDKLIALSKLFSVTVGWLLGVEEEEQPQEADEPREFTDRERELIDALTQSRPAVPVWQKYVCIGAAIVSALSVTLSAVSLYRTTHIGQVLNQTLSRFELSALTPAAQGSYDFDIQPSADLNSIGCTFTYSPSVLPAGISAELVIYHEGQEYLRQACTQSDTGFAASFSLPTTAAGYEPILVLTTAGGSQTVLALHDAVVENPLAAMRFETPQVKFDRYALADSVLTLQGIHFDFSLPSAFRDIPNPWKGCDLVIRVNGQEQSRVDILNRSQYSKQVNFSERHVDFTTEGQSFALNAADGDTVELVLECVFLENLEMEKVVFTWVMVGTTLKAA